MAYEVVWSPRAVDDVQSIATYIAEDSFAYARSVAQKIVVTIAAVVHGKRPVELELQP
jgi:toxin ParE1/3/4